MNIIFNIGAFFMCVWTILLFTAILTEIVLSDLFLNIIMYFICICVFYFIFGNIWRFCV